MAFDVALVERRARRAYEVGRIRYALAASAPLLAVVALALWFGSRSTFDFAAAAVLVAIGLVYRWRGTMAERALLPGLGAGSIPLVLALVANGSSAGCHQGDALSLCTIACAVGGVLAALRITEFAHSEEHTPGAFGLAMIPTFLMGSLGCGCAGFSGVLFLAGALLLTSVPEMVRWAHNPS